MTLQQPLFQYNDYPGDSQNIQIRYESYAFTTAFVRIVFRNGQCIQFTDASSGTQTFKANQVWGYDSTQCFIQTSVFSPIRAFDTATAEITVTRYSSGLMLRLVLPIALLCMLAGCTFWASMESRNDTILTLLLSVSALYIVIFSNIPLLGYLTSLDKFCFLMYFLLVVVSLVHHIVSRMHEKEDKWPLRGLVLRVLEFLGRIAVIPLTTLSFAFYFQSIHLLLRILTLMFNIIFVVFVVSRDLKGLIHCCKTTMNALHKKADNPTERTISTLEVLVLNLVFYGIVSTSLATNSRRKYAKDQDILELVRSSPLSHVQADSDVGASDTGLPILTVKRSTSNSATGLSTSSGNGARRQTSSNDLNLRFVKNKSNSNNIITNHDEDDEF